MLDYGYVVFGEVARVYFDLYGCVFELLVYRAVIEIGVGVGVECDLDVGGF